MLSFEMCSDAGTEFRSILRKRELLPCHQTLPDSRAAQGFFVFYLFSSCLRGFSSVCSFDSHFFTMCLPFNSSVASLVDWPFRIQESDILTQWSRRSKAHTQTHTHSHCRLVSVYLTSEFSGFIYLAVLEAAPWWPFKKLSSSENVRVT